MTTTRRQRTGTRTGYLLAVAASSVAVLALAGTAAASPAATAKATANCWNEVISDWLQHEPNVKGTYPLACYRQAIQHLEGYPDIQQYSNAPGDIHRALLAAMRHKDDGGPSGPTGGSSAGPGGGGNGPGGGAGPSSNGPPDAGGAGHGQGFITKVVDAVGPGNAQSIPLPLLVLGGLAVLLLLAAAGTWIAKRIQARRMTPAQAPVRRS